MLALWEALYLCRRLCAGLYEGSEAAALNEERFAVCLYFALGFFISYMWIILNSFHTLPFNLDSKFGALESEDVRKQVTIAWFVENYIMVSTVPAGILATLLIARSAIASGEMEWAQWTYNFVMIMNVFLLAFAYIAAGTNLPETCHACTRAYDDSYFIRSLEDSAIRLCYEIEQHKEYRGGGFCKAVDDIELGKRTEFSAPRSFASRIRFSTKYHKAS
ncbi:hypothetical protein BU16DRAFT_567323 [Lophium mytilinum]|uniref:Uncharacterized protein n=1 Tax=Lophium mytilinum TaxID=390894 RepID=A0A6A6QAI6_9PEZI|nr:hypothetical protein BU16DRAFT_567323 [Lophium mytilinum]